MLDAHILMAYQSPHFSQTIWGPLSAASYITSVTKYIGGIVILLPENFKNK